MTSAAKLRRILAVLRERCPTRCKVRFTLRRLKDDGCYTFSSRTHWISVNRGLPYSGQCDTLLHEYAHAVTWERSRSDGHCDEWGRAYAEVYRAYLDGWIDDTKALAEC